jgi:hypothetical protein
VTEVQAHVGNDQDVDGLPEAWRGDARLPLDADTAFNGFIAANVIFALDRMGILQRLSTHPTIDVSGVVRGGGAQEAMAADIIRLACRYGFLSRDGDVLSLTGSGRDMLTKRGFFTWAVGGYSAVFAAAGRLAAGTAGYGSDVRRDESMAALGSAQCDEELFADILDEALDGLSFAEVVDLGSGTAARLCRILGDRPGVRGLALDLSEPATELARHNIDRAGLSGRLRAVRADAFDVILRGHLREDVANADVVLSFFLLHDLLAPVQTHRTILPRMRAAFPSARTFVLADTMMSPRTLTEPAMPVFTAGFELAHALMSVPLNPRPAYDELFGDAGLRIRSVRPFGAPHSYLYVLDAD